MNRWSTLASDDAATTAQPAAAYGGAWARAHSPSAGFASPIERPGTTPSPRKPDPRRTLNLETAPTRLDLAVEVLLVALLAFMPAALGVVAPWSETVVVATAAAIALCLALRAVFHRNGDGRPTAWSWSYLPILLFVLVALAQLVPLPAAVIRAISPGTFETKAGLLADVPGAVDRTTLSFYPFAASRDLRLVLVCAVVFVAVVNTFQRTAQLKRLLAAVVAIGGAFALLAFLQDLTGSQQIYWSVRTYGAARSGPFVNHNHYAQFMNLSIGAAVALLLVRLREELPRRLGPTQVLDRLQDPEFRPAWYLVAVIVMGAITTLLSLSRGGVIAMLVATAFTALALAVRRGLRGIGWVLSLLGLLVFVALLYAGFDAVADRLATLHTAHDPTSGRMQVFKDVAVSWRKFPLAGMGLGSWEVTYPMFDRSKDPAVAEYADSDYAQALHELGAAGLAVVVLFAAMIWANYARATKAGRVPVCAAAFGLGYGLMAAMVQGAMDYGQHMPAVAVLTAVTCGLLVCLAKIARTNARAEREHAKASPGDLDDVQHPELSHRGNSRRGRLVAVPATLGRLALPAALLAAMAWALLGVNTARIADAHWSAAQDVARRLEADGWQGSNADYAALIIDAAAAAERQPGNVQYRYWLNACRWRSISRASDPETGELLMTDRSLGAAERIVGELHAARLLCPTFGPVPSLAGQLELLVLDRPADGARHVRLGRELSPNDPAAGFAAAVVDVTEGRWDASLEKFRRCLVLNGNMITEVLATYVGAGRADLALAAAEGNSFFLQKLVTRLGADARHPDALRQAEDKFLASLSSDQQQAGASGWLLSEAANLRRDRGDHAAAAALYQKAVSKDYDQVAWRLELARCLAADPATAEQAMREARLCLRLRPQMVAARKLIEELSVRPAAGAPKGGAGGEAARRGSDAAAK